jgi:thiamine kinase-like enzyme
VKYSANILISTALQRGVLALLCLTITEVMAADIKAFNMTGVDHELVLRYFLDKQSTSQSGSKTQYTSRPTFQEEYRINTQSYIFHPNLLSMDLGANILLDQSRFETLDAENSNREQLLGYNARLDFLKSKPYPASVYYIKDNPTVSVGIGDRILLQSTRYGIDLALLEQISPVKITFNAGRQTTKGDGFDLTTDEASEHARLAFYRAYGKGNYAQLSHQLNNRDSNSGSTGLPIEARTTSNTSTFFDSKNLFGGKGQAQLITNVAYTTQEEFPKREELRAFPVLNWQHNEKINSFYRFLYTDSEEETNTINQKVFTSGFGYSDQQTNGHADLHLENSKNTGTDFQSKGINYSINHTIPVGIGSVTAGYSGGLDYRDQVSDSAVFTVFGEEHEMIGTTPINLNRQFIIDSSIVVSNIARTQIYIEDQDYRVLRVGSTSQIQRLDNGNILNGQLVLVDYEYLTGGTFAYDLTNNNIRLQWNPSNFYELYIRYLESKQELREGDPTIPLNSINRMTYGAKADHPMLNGITLGGEAYIQDHEEDINSFLLKYLDAYIDLPLPRLTTLRFTTRRQLIDNEQSVEDVDLTAYILRLLARPWLRTQLSYEVNYEEDTGGTLNRLQKVQRLQLRWAYRQLTLSGNIFYSSVTQGTIENDRLSVRLNLVRTF